MKYIITVSRDWREYGTIEIEAENEEEAREFARGELIDDTDKIEWNESNMSLLAEDIEKIKPADI